MKSESKTQARRDGKGTNARKQDVNQPAGGNRAGSRQRRGGTHGTLPATIPAGLDSALEKLMGRVKWLQVKFEAEKRGRSWHECIAEAVTDSMLPSRGWEEAWELIKAIERSTWRSVDEEVGRRKCTWTQFMATAIAHELGSAQMLRDCVNGDGHIQATPLAPEEMVRLIQLSHELAMPRPMLARLLLVEALEAREKALIRLPAPAREKAA